MPLKLGWKAYLCKNVSQTAIQAAEHKLPPGKAFRKSLQDKVVFRNINRKILHSQDRMVRTYLGPKELLNSAARKGVYSQQKVSFVASFF